MGVCGAEGFECTYMYLFLPLSGAADYTIYIQVYTHTEVV